MTGTIKFFVPGIPKTAGSKRAFPIWRGKGASKKFVRSVVVDSSGQAGKDWRASVQFAARREWGDKPPSEAPLALYLMFQMTRPKCHFSKKGLKPSAPLHHTTKPDVLKMARAVEDALTGIIWRDDSQIVHEVLQKTYVDAPGCWVEIQETEQV